MTVIRELREEDNPVMAQIVKQSLESVGLAIPGTAYFDPQLQNLTAYYANLPHAKYWVATDEQDQVVGGVGIAPFGDHPGVCELQKLYLAPQAKGKGLGSELLEVALTFAEQHYERCYIETMQQLHTANRLYGTVGFHLLEEPLPGSEHGTMDAWYLKSL